MPELAEVEYYRKQWNPGLGKKITAVRVHPKARIFRECDLSQLQEHLENGKLISSEAAAKQMLFRTTRQGWLGIHLGMSGELRVEPSDYKERPSDHLILVQSHQQLVFSDFRMFGRVQFSVGKEVPAWWQKIPPALLSAEFTVEAIRTFLERRSRTAIKAVLLMQERFPGIGNWMADEILWRAGIHPQQRAGTLTGQEIKTLHQEIRWVSEHALATIGETMEDPPETWLFPHRWREGGHCPRTGAKLSRAVVGGRMTCWSPARQKLHP
ncbi:MAG TPA: DNA-formamidopyrimidine glycosylase family protein [Opitutaceae bacterium]|nr:DNA-formamidopyrimidine glycosylase family protein [Opitutaceae bacterium]